jgi:hypothetical protein
MADSPKFDTKHQMNRALSIAVIFWCAFGTTRAAQASFTGISGPAASYCAVGMECDPGDSCAEEDLQLGWRLCSATCTYPTCDWESNVIAGAVQDFDWQIDGEMPAYCIQGDICGFWAYTNLFGKRVGQNFILEVYYYSSTWWADFGGDAQAALIRFSGDPAAFDGLAPRSVHDLVDAGLIAESDILLLMDEFPIPEPNHDELFTFEIPVNGINDNEIFIFHEII